MNDNSFMGLGLMHFAMRERHATEDALRLATRLLTLLIFFNPPVARA